MSRKFSLCTICILVFTCCFVSAQKQLTIEDCIIGTASYLKPNTIKALKWQPGTQYYTYVEGESLIQASANNDEKDQIMGLDELNILLSEKGMETFSSFPQYYWINEHELFLSDYTQFIWFQTEKQEILQAVKIDRQAENLDFSHDFRNIAYTLENNLFYTDQKGNNYTIRYSPDKSVVSGQTVHRNEFGISKGTFWSPDGNKLAFYIKDESNVSDYPLVDVTQRVATLHNIKYPMAGMASEIVQVGIYNTADLSTVILSTGVSDDHYLTNIAWSPDGKYIFIAELNRDQNHLKMNQYNADDGSFVKTLFEEKDPHYIDPLNPLVFIPGNPDQFIWQSQADGFNHLYVYNTDGKLIRQLTDGSWEVMSVEGFDKTGDHVFFIANKEGALNEMLYEANLKNGKIIAITPESGVHHISLNTDGDLILDQYSSTAVPNSIEIRNEKGKFIRQVLKAEDPLKEYTLAETEDGLIMAADGKTPLHYRLFKPQDLILNKKYPVIVYVYNGPLNQLIKNEWINRTELWLHYMTDLGYIGFMLDGRGSDNRGKEFEQVIFRSLGTNEMQDQVKGVEFLKTLDYIDPARIGIFGWSYGGFMSISLMTTYPEIFKTGVAGGPVTDWKYYEVMYGERYMDTPEANPEGYRNSSLLNKIQNLQGNLLVIHGAIDPVVVWQHSLMLLRRCVEEDVLIDYYVYPTHEHNVTGADRVHLMKKITDYFIRNL